MESWCQRCLIYLRGVRFAHTSQDITTIQDDERKMGWLYLISQDLTQSLSCPGWTGTKDLAVSQSLACGFGRTLQTVVYKEEQQHHIPSVTQSMCSLLHFFQSRFPE